MDIYALMTVNTHRRRKCALIVLAAYSVHVDSMLVMKCNLAVSLWHPLSNCM